MAADGTWPGPRAGTPGSDADGADRTLAQLRSALAAVEARLDARSAPPLGPDALLALVRALDALARRAGDVAAQQAQANAELGSALSALAARMEGVAGRLDEALGEIAVLRRDVARRPDPPLVRVLLATAAGAAALAVAGAGTVLLVAPERLPPALAAPMERFLRILPRIAAPRPAPVVADATRTIPPSQPRGETYDDVAAALARGEATALARLQGLAQAGDARAELHLASLYEAGRSGLPRDLAAARDWTRRAAVGGERVAMHNLALFLEQGEGGPRDVAEAAAWFRRAAGAGVVDAQYNLGRMYEAGRGVDRNLREAYRWYSIAANAGDLTARERQLALESQLAPGERSDLDRAVAAFRPGAPAGGDSAIVIPPAATVAETQALLARQGYYLGPVDGVATPSLRAAANAYLADHPGPTAPSVSR